MIRTITLKVDVADNDEYATVLGAILRDKRVVGWHYTVASKALNEAVTRKAGRDSAWAHMSASDYAKTRRRR